MTVFGSRDKREKVGRLTLVWLNIRVKVDRQRGKEGESLPINRRMKTETEREIGRESSDQQASEGRQRGKEGESLPINRREKEGESLPINRRVKVDRQRGKQGESAFDQQARER